MHVPAAWTWTWTSSPFGASRLLFRWRGPEWVTVRAPHGVKWVYVCRAAVHSLVLFFSYGLDPLVSPLVRFLTLKKKDCLHVTYVKGGVIAC
jgi:hypothetical protein